METDTGEQLRDVLKAKMPNGSAQMARQMSKVFMDYEHDGHSAINDWDKFNLDQIFDKSLSYQENKGRLIDTLIKNGYYNPKEVELDAAKKRKEEDRLLKRSIQEERDEKVLFSQEETKAKFEAALTNLMTTQDNDVNEFIRQYIPAIRSFHEFLDMTLTTSEYINSCLITGPRGIGKSRHVMTELKKHGKNYIFYNSHSTPLGLYEILYKNANSVIVLDDIDSILEDKKSISLLKAACFSASGERLVTWASTSKILTERGLPDRFIFYGKVIIIANDNASSRKESYKAFVNRLYTYEIKMTEIERKLMVRTIFTKQPVFGLSDDDKDKLLAFMESILEFSNIENYNLRTAFKCAEVWNYNKSSISKAKDLIYDMMGTDENLRIFLTIEEEAKSLPVFKRIEVWKQYTGYAQAEYYRTKARYYKTYYGNKHMAMIKDDIADIVKSLE